MQSLNNKTQALKIFADSKQADIICTTEHWLTSQNINLYNLRGYTNVAFFCRSNSIHGGVCIFVHNEIRAIGLEYITENSSEKDFEITGVHLPDQHIVVMCVYRSPAAPTEVFMHGLDSTLTQVYHKHDNNTRVIVAGDVNIDLLTNNSQTKQLTNLMTSYGLKPLIKEPTRTTELTSTCIDNIFTDITNVQTTVEDPHYGDHRALILRITRNSETKETTKIRIYSANNISRFQTLLEMEEWTDSETDPNRMMQKFIDTLMKHHNEAFPWTTRKTNRLRDSTELLNVRETLKLMRRLQDGNSNEETYIALKNYEKFYVQLAEKEHKKRNSDRILNASNKTGTIWKTINAELGMAKPTYQPLAPTSDQFSDHFTRVRQPTHNTQTSPFLPKQCTHSMYLWPTDKEEIETVLQGLKSKRTEDIYGISTDTLKTVAHIISEPLATIFNASLKGGVFPERLKIARITPVHKKGDKQDCNNYRPIAVLPAISKVLEKIILTRLYCHLQQHLLLSEQQFAYQPKKGTSDAMKLLTRTVCGALEERLYCKTQMCDLSHAFDSMPHALLLDKMERYGVRGVGRSLIASYLSNRLQQVRINGESSGFREVLVGVPQGSLLGGALFIIFMNDLPSRIEAKTIIYADDTTIITTATTRDDLHRASQHHMQEAKTWFESNQLELNEQKTEELTFEMDRWETTQKPVKFLGITLDARLTWSSHIESLSKLLSRAIYAIRRINKTAGYEASRVAYFSMFQARMSYGIQTWGHSSHTKTILILQKRAVRGLTSEHPLTNAKPLFQKHRILTVYAVYLLYCLCDIHRTRMKDPVVHNHQYDTRKKNDLRPDYRRLTTTAHYTKPVKIYNSLPDQWKTETNRRFKLTLTQHLLEAPPYDVDEFVFSIRQFQNA